jgi:hypothetical protein
MFMRKLARTTARQREARPSAVRLSRGSRLERTASIAAGVRRGLERGAERIVVAKRLEIRIVAGEGAIFRVQSDRTLEVRDGFSMLVTLGVRDGEHVDRVIVVGILVADEAQMRDRLVVLPAVDGERRRVEALVDGLRRGLLVRCLPLTDVEVERTRS